MRTFCGRVLCKVVIHCVTTNWLHIFCLDRTSSLHAMGCSAIIPTYVLIVGRFAHVILILLSGMDISIAIQG